MSIQLVAIDVDDTLLTSKHQVLTSTITAVKAAIAQGVKVVLCSGRPLAGVAPYLAQLGIKGADQYVITYNGAITATTSGQVMAQYLIDNAQYRRLTTFAMHHQASFNVLDAHSTIYTADHDVNRITVVQAWENNAGLLIRQPDELPTAFQITKGVFGGEKAALDELEPIVRQTFSDELAVIRAGANFLEVLNPVVSKGQALKALMAHLAVAPAAVMAIGDEANDLSMFDAAGTAVAMGNGSWLAREHADIVTKSNDDGGIAAVFEQSIFNKAVDKSRK